MGSGGRRAGAGRPAIENKRVTLAIRIKPENKAYIERKAKQLKKSKGEFIDMLIEQSK